MTRLRVTRHQCPICQTLLETHAPGLSYVERDGIRYHPKCWEEETGESVTDQHQATSSKTETL